MTTLNEWFFLKEDRLNFKPSVAKDGNLYFCHDEIQAQIKSIIERCFAIGEPVKMIIFGDWGVGKTHSVQHIKWWLNQNSSTYSTKTYLIEVGDVTKKSRFDILVRRFLDQIGISELIQLVHQYHPCTGEMLTKALTQIGVSKPICDAFGKFLLVSPGDTPPEAVQLAFSYLKGSSAKNSSSIGLGDPISESEDFYGVMVAIGELYKKVRKQQLILIADEAAKLEAVEADDATSAHWLATNRLIFQDENTSFGFVYTISSKGRKNIPPFLTNAQIENRLGKQNYIELLTLEPQDVDQFLKRLCSDFIDHCKVQDAVNDGRISSEDYDPSSYPFNKQARKEFIEFFDRTQQDSKPRDICDKLNVVAFQALKAKRRLIDSECLEQAGVN